MLSISSNPILKTSFVCLLVVTTVGCQSRRHSRYTTQVRRTPTHYRCVPQQIAPTEEEAAPLPKPELLVKPAPVKPKMQVPKKEMNSVPPKIEPIPAPLKKNASPINKKPPIMTPNQSYNEDIAPPAKSLPPKKQSAVPQKKKEVTPSPKPEITPKRRKRKIEEDDDLFIRKDLPPAPPVEKSPQVNRPSFKDLVAMSISHSAARSRERELVFKKRKKNTKRISNHSSLGKLPIITPRSENQIDFYQSVQNQNSIPLPKKSKANRPLITLETPIFLESPFEKRSDITAPPITRIDLTIPENRFPSKLSPPKIKTINSQSISHPASNKEFRLNLPSWNESPTKQIPAKSISYTSKKRSAIQILLPSRSAKQSSIKPEPRKLWFR